MWLEMSPLNQLSLSAGGFVTANDWKCLRVESDMWLEVSPHLIAPAKCVWR